MFIAAILFLVGLSIVLGFPIAGALGMIAVGIMVFTSGADLLI